MPVEAIPIDSTRAPEAYALVAPSEPVWAPSPAGGCSDGSIVAAARDRRPASPSAPAARHRPTRTSSIVHGNGERASITWP